eukprot:COSAG04_NODE_22991_length_346_cov_0.263158_1_plen_51_part_01
MPPAGLAPAVALLWVSAAAAAAAPRAGRGHGGIRAREDGSSNGSGERQEGE